MKARKYLYFAILGFLCSISLPAVWAQTAAGQPATGALRGQVADPSGAAIPAASVVLTPATGAPVVIQSDAQGGYDFKGVPAGKYTLTIAAPGFTLYENDNVVVADHTGATSGAPQTPHGLVATASNSATPRRAALRQLGQIAAPGGKSALKPRSPDR